MMRSSRLKTLAWGGVLAGFVLAGATAGLAFAQAPAIFTPAGVTAAGAVPATAPTYERNADGLTYGSAMEAISPETEPDLILVIATNGREGYVFRTDLNEANGATAAKSFDSPEDALRWQAQAAGKSTTIKVYAVDGKTEVGEFTVIPGEGGRVE